MRVFMLEPLPNSIRLACSPITPVISSMWRVMISSSVFVR